MSVLHILKIKKNEHLFFSIFFQNVLVNAILNSWGNCILQIISKEALFIFLLSICMKYSETILCNVPHEWLEYFIMLSYLLAGGLDNIFRFPKCQ